MPEPLLTTTAVTTRDMSAYKAYGIQRVVRDAKHWYRERVESHFIQGDI